MFFFLALLILVCFSCVSSYFLFPSHVLWRLCYFPPHNTVLVTSSSHSGDVKGEDITTGGDSCCVYFLGVDA